jgi:hypothetical protein
MDADDVALEESALSQRRLRPQEGDPLRRNGLDSAHETGLTEARTDQLAHGLTAPCSRRGLANGKETYR